MKRSSEKNNRKADPRPQVVIDVTKDDYRREIASGVLKEYALKPGRHVFRRGGFKARHPEFAEVKKTPVKVRINIYLDLDIVNYFKERAKSPDAAAYQTQINTALRSLLGNQTVSPPEFAKLIDSEDFIAAVAERVSKRRERRSTGKKRFDRKSLRTAKRT
jgi:uncharacterized protein (DUF4415 family)